MARADLIGRLEPSGPLNTLVAPAGFGKSAVLAEWAGSVADGAVTWLRCDHHDDEPNWLAANLAWSMKARIASAGTAAGALAEAGAEPDEVLATLIEGVAAHAGPVVTVIDEWHTVTSAAAVDLLAGLAERLPPNWRILAADRHPDRVPSLPAPLTAHDLRFDDDGAVGLLRDTFGLRVSATSVQRVNAQARGWVTGLCLAAAAARSAADPEVALRRWSGGHHYVVDYLAAEVLASLDERLAEFLLDSALLAPFCAEQCDAVTGNDDAAALIERLELDQLVLCEDDRPGWYRYDGVFTDGLRAEAERRDPDRCRSLLRRAADWSTRNADPAGAMRCAARAGEHELVTRLLGGYGYGLIDQGRSQDVLACLAEIPAKAIATEPELDLLGAHAAWTIGEFDAQTAHLQRARRGARRLEDTFRAAGVRRALALSVPMELARRGLTEDALALGEATVAPIRVPPDGAPRHFGTDPARQHGALSSLAYWAGALDLAAGHAAAALAMEPDRRSRANALGIQAMLRVLRGDGAEAARLAREAVSLLDDVVRPRPFQLTCAATALAWSGSDDEAAWAERALRGLPTLGHWWLSDVHLLVVAGEVQLRRGSVADAERFVGLAQRAVDGVNQPGIMERLIAVQTERIAARRPDADPLAITGRERAVLRLLASPLSRREIGAELDVSLNTIKTHLRQLYRKLGVTSRSAAVERARADGLI